MAIDARTRATAVIIHGYHERSRPGDGACATGAPDSSSTGTKSAVLASGRAIGTPSTTDVRDEPVTATSDGLHEARARRRIIERVPNPVDGFVHAVVEVDEGVGSPQSVTKLFAGDRLTRPFEQHHQNLKGLLLKSQPHAVLPQFPGSKINLEDAETEADRRTGLGHGMAIR